MSPAFEHQSKELGDTLKDGSCLVFGGDASDRYVGDLGLTRRLLRLHKKHPGRVFFIMGNRDVNKLRFATELSRKCLSIPGTECTNAIFDCNDDCQAKAKETGLVPRTKWILQYTMGARKAFANRMKEMEEEGEEDTPALKYSTVYKYSTRSYKEAKRMSVESTEGFPSRMMSRRM